MMKSIFEKIIECFQSGKVLYTKHARDEMAFDEFGEILEQEVTEAICGGKIIEEYLEDEPYPSFLVSGRTSANRPLHIVCAYAEDDSLSIVITVYQPDPKRWINDERRRK